MPIRRYLTGQGLSHVQNLENNTFHAYHQDEQGSTAYVTGTTGETENLYSYDGFGNLLEKRENIPNSILYTGQQYDQETGQYYLRARYYNPVIGRFTQEDTYRGDGLNLYVYCDNNPVMYYDPSGHGCEGTDAENTPQETPPVGEIDGVGESGTNSQIKDGYTQDATGRYHSDENGRFVSYEEAGATRPNTSKVSDGKHGNSLESTNPNHVYVIVDDEGKMVKVGISGQPINKDGSSRRAEPQVSAINEAEKQKQMKIDPTKSPRETHAVIVETDLSRREARDLEHKITDKYAARNDGKMPSEYHQRPTPRTTSINEYIEFYGESPNKSTGGRY